MDRLEITITDDREGWVSATVEDFDGRLVGESHVPVTDGANFNSRAAAIRDATEQAIQAHELQEQERRIAREKI